MRTIGFIGAGNMACALGGGIGAAGSDAVALIASDPSEVARKRFVEETGARAVADAAVVAGEADILVLAVKPQIMPAVLAELAPLVRDTTVVVSIAAGITLKSMSSALGEDARLVRAMPNTPALVRRGMTVVVRGGAATRQDLASVEEILTSVGTVRAVDDEALLDAVTAVSGSGPGFAFAYGEAMVAAAEAAGLAPELAITLVQETLAGAAELWRDSGEDAGELRRRVTSPGGTTEAGLAALAAHGLGEAIGAAVAAATARSRELSGQ